MVKVKFTFKNGTTKITEFPKSTLTDVRSRAPRINKKIVRVEYAPRKKTKAKRASSPFAIPRGLF